MKVFGKCPFFFFQKKKKKIAEDMKIYNSQLVMSLDYRSASESLQSTFTGLTTIHGMVCREIRVRAPARLASCKKNKNNNKK